MVLLRSCCCWQSVRSGSLASGIYTMTFYSVIVTAGSFHVHTITGLPEPITVLLIFSILMLAFAALSVITSVILIVGLCTNNRVMLLPWIVCITMTTILDVILSFYLVSDSNIDPFFGVLVATDYFICGLNVYCILCVTSQYQEYSNIGNGQGNNLEGLPAIHFEAASTLRANESPARMISISVLQNKGSPTSSVCRPLLSSGDSPLCRPTPSSNLITSSSPVLMLSRSSFSSTSEISFYSSDILSSSRRSSALPSQDVRPGLSPVGEVAPSSFIAERPVEEVEEEEIAEGKEEDSQANLNKTQIEDPLSGKRDYFEERSSPSTSRFRVAGVFSSMRSTTRLTKVVIADLQEQPEEETPNENSSSVT